MKGLVIWAQSDCRSMMGLYRALIRVVGVPVVVAVRDYKDKGQRHKVGFRHDEFGDIQVVNIGEDYKKGLEILDGHHGYCHLFGAYQNAPVYCSLILEADKRGEQIGILSEAPCVMTAGVKGFLKERFYLPVMVKHKVKAVVSAAKFVVNLSGDSTSELRNIGWAPEKIVPFGYFPPSIIGSKVIQRKDNRDFHILVTGIMTWHRAPDIVIKALALLKKLGVPYRATFTQDGPLKPKLEKFAKEHELPVTFSGFLPLEKLIELYETCSVYVAAGRREPWGMRLNDALNCGAPLLVSRGMGGVKLVDDYVCGVSFNVDDYVDLAHKLCRMITDRDFYLTCAYNAFAATAQISPENKARELLKTIAKAFVI